LLVHGSTIYGSIANIAKSMMQLPSNKYKLNIGIALSDTLASQQWHIAVVIPKQFQNEVVYNLYYPHIEVWKFTSRPYEVPDFTLTLTLDTLLKNYYTSSSPEDLILNFPYARFYMIGGWEGKYLVVTYDNGLGGINDRMLFYDAIDGGSPAGFNKTMYSPDTMLLKSTAPRPEGRVNVADFLFIKQN
jgi:hypothetical protein